MHPLLLLHSGFLFDCLSPSPVAFAPTDIKAACRIVGSIISAYMPHEVSAP